MQTAYEKGLKISNRDKISEEMLAQLTGYSPRHIRKLSEDNFIPKPEDGLYSALGALKGLFQYLKEERGKSKEDAAELKRQKVETEVAILKITLQKVQKEVCEISVVERIWGALVLNFRQHVMRVPAKVAPRLPFCKNETEMEGLIYSELEDCMIELSRPQDYFPKVGPDEVRRVD